MRSVPSIREACTTSIDVWAAVFLSCTFLAHLYYYLVIFLFLLPLARVQAQSIFRWRWGRLAHTNWRQMVCTQKERYFDGGRFRGDLNLVTQQLVHWLQVHSVGLQRRSSWLLENVNTHHLFIAWVDMD